MPFWLRGPAQCPWCKEIFGDMASFRQHLVSCDKNPNK